jgi:hypothetical protein
MFVFAIPTHQCGVVPFVCRTTPHERYDPLNQNPLDQSPHNRNPVNQSPLDQNPSLTFDLKIQLPVIR